MAMGVIEGLRPGRSGRGGNLRRRLELLGLLLAKALRRLAIALWRLLWIVGKLVVGHGVFSLLLLLEKESLLPILLNFFYLSRAAFESPNLYYGFKCSRLQGELRPLIE
jgi:hypothetical protein